MDRPAAGPAGAAPAPTVRAQGVVFRDGRLLCARHEKEGEAYRVLPGGHVEPGETVWEALVRELDEETGVTVREGRLWAVGEFVRPGRHVLDLAFLVTASDGEASLGSDPDALDHPATLTGLDWVDRSAFESGPFRPSTLRRRLIDVWDDPDAPATWVGVERAAGGR